MSLRLPRFWPRRGPDESQSTHRPVPVHNTRQKNTGDLQWKIDAVYNARACDDERKAAGARTMGSNGKNNENNVGRTMGTGGNPDECLRPVVRPQDRRRRCARGAVRRTEFVREPERKTKRA